MKSNVKKILLTRTVPISDFFVMLKEVKSKYKEVEFRLLVQSSVLEIFKKELSFFNYVIKDGMFRLELLSSTVIQQLIQENIDTIVIFSNHNTFLGYDEFIKLALKIKINEIIMINKELKWKTIGIKEIWAQRGILIFKKIVSLLYDITEFIFHIFIIIIFTLIYPILWIMRKLKSKRNS